MSKKTKTLKGKTPSRRKFIKAAAVTGVAAVAASSLAAPAVAADRVEIAIVTTWPRNFPGIGTGAQRFAKRMMNMSDGRFQVEYFAAGERVKAFETFDEVSSGNAQMYHAADYYWVDKDKAWSYFTAVPFGFTYTEMNAWIRFGGGQYLWDELADKYGLRNFLCGNTGGQMGGWFNKKINSAKDFKDLKMRMPGLGGQVIAKLGASLVPLHGGQIYEKLASGVIDATEWVGPWNDEIMKLQEVAEYYYFPGMHEPSSALAVGCNNNWFADLSRSDQRIIEAAAAMENDVMMAEYNLKNAAALNRLINEHGVKLEHFNDKVYDAFAKGAEEVFGEVQASSDLAARTHASFVKWRRDIGSWTNLSDASYVRQRNRALKFHLKSNIKMNFK